MTNKATAVFGIFNDRAEAEAATARLKSAGFKSSEISVLFPDKEGTRDFAHEKNTKAPEGAALVQEPVLFSVARSAGSSASARWRSRALARSSRPARLMAALAGAGVGGAMGGITGALVGMGIPEFEAKRYEGMVKNGGILMSIHSEDASWTKKGKAVLEESGARDVSSTGESRGEATSQAVA